MAIGSAIERGSLICVYDQHGRTLFTKAKGSASRTNCRFTSFGSTIFTYVVGNETICKGGIEDCPP